MWDFLTKKCGIFGIEGGGGTKLWDFQHRGGDFRPLTSGHTVLWTLIFASKNLVLNSFEKLNLHRSIEERIIAIFDEPKKLRENKAKITFQGKNVFTWFLRFYKRQNSLNNYYLFTKMLKWERVHEIFLNFIHLGM